MSDSSKRIEKDSLGQLEVPINAFYGAQTQRAIDNFAFSDLTMPRQFIQALGLIKAACATVNLDLKELTEEQATSIIKAAQKVASGEYDQEFPIDVFQTGSGTSSNMNINEVIAHLAQKKVHPNDHVNRGQSSNDVIPTAIHVSACLAVHQNLLPALEHLKTIIQTKAKNVKNVVKTGRTHLMDAMPLTLEQELSGWSAQIEQNIERITDTLKRVHLLALGGTAIGTGINAHPEFGTRVAKALALQTKISFQSNPNLFSAIASQDAIVELSGQLRTLAASLTKIANDLRWMNSGPLTGLGEITLPILQPGSSIMPGKINPVIPEAVVMACAQVMGNDTTIGISGASGNFQLNTMLPVIAYNILQSIQLMANSARSLADKAITDFQVNESHLQDNLAKNPILITALNAVIGYEKGAEIAKRAYLEKRPVKEIAAEMTDLSPTQLDKLLDPHLLTSNRK